MQQEGRFTTNPRRSARNAQNQVQQSIADESQNGHQFESPQHQQTNGHVEDHSTNGLATNGNAHADHPSATNGDTPPTSTNIIAEIDEDNYSYTSDFSNSSADSNDWDMEATEMSKPKNEDGFPDNQFPIILAMGQKISKFAENASDIPPELQQKMDVRV